MSNRYRLTAPVLSPMLLGIAMLGPLPTLQLAHAGGYVNGTQVLTQARSVLLSGPGVNTVATFDNATLTDQNTIAEVNNDPIKTPSTSDPVSTVTGNNYHDETDLMIRGRGLNLAFTRTYNSAPSSTKVDIGLGFGWVHSYAMRLKANDYGACANCSASQAPENGNTKTSSITYTDERGGEHNYLVNESSFAVTPPQGEFDSLAFDTPLAGSHTLSFRNGARYVFETIGAGSLKTTPNLAARLKQINDPWGNQLNFTYDANGRLSNVSDNLGIPGRTGLTLTYDANGRLKDMSDWSARTWRYSYDAAGNLMTKTNPLGEILSYSYDAPKHLLTGVTLPLARAGVAVKTGFAYYQNGRTFQQTDSFDVGDTLDYDLYRKSTRVTDARGGIRTHEYDAAGRLTKLTEPDRAILQFQNQADGLRYAKRDGLGYPTQYSYRADKSFDTASDTGGQVTREQDALNQTIDMSYGPYDQLASVKDKRGTVMTTTYASTTSGCDYANRPKDTRINTLNGAANVLLTSYCWNPDGTPNFSRQYLDATRYRETRLTYQPGSNGLNVSQQQMLGQPAGVTITQTFTYDSLGRRTSETLKRRTSPTNAALIDLTTSYAYDALDRVIKMTDALGNEVLNSFDANGQLWQVTQRLRKPDATFDVRIIMTRTFDANNRVKSQTDVLGNLTTYQYDPAGNVISITDAENHTTQFEYDPRNRRTAIIDATGYRTETQYSLRGDVLTITNANQETLQFENDALGRNSATVDARGYRSEFRYDANGNLTCSVNANAQANLQPKNVQGCSESRQYDELNRVTQITDAQNNTTRLTYDLAGNRLSLTDAENKTANFAYDDLGRLQSETDHLGLATTNKLDQAGNTYEQTNRLNEVTRVSFDNANRPTRVDYLKDNTAETFGYDVAGNRTAVANSNVSYNFAYDRANRLQAKTDSRGKSLSFSFDKVGNILTKTTYQGSTTSYLYNAANRLVQLRNPDYLQADYQYDPAGRLLSRVTSNGARSVYQYDANGGLTKLTQYDAANAIISDVSYSRDRLGNILTQTDAAGTSTYSYDPLYRLQSADYPGAANDEVYSYDKVGNRQSKTQGSLIPNANTRYYSYSAGTNRLSQIRIGSSIGAIESSFTQDLEGRLVSQTGVGAKTLAWDAKGRVKSINTETYSYDPMDYRIQRSGGSLGNLSYFLEGEHLESVEDASGIKERYLRGSSIDELVAGYLKDTDGKTKPYLFHQDNVTSTTALSGHNGGVIQSLSYSTFGQTISSTGASPNRLGYTGRENDGTGLYYYRARYYDPQIGRFISEDPLGFAAGDVNFYAYVGNNPTNANDPSGEIIANVVGGLIGFGGELAGQYLESVISGTEFRPDYGRALVSGVAGAAGVGLVNLGNRLVQGASVAARAGRVGVGAAVEVGSNVGQAVANGDQLTLGGVARAAVLGGVSARAGEFAETAFYGSNLAQRASNAGDRLRRIAGSRIEDGLPRPGRVEARLDAARAIDDSLESSANFLSGFTGSAISLTGNILNRDSFFTNTGSGSSASGGFVLYPNKANTNTLRSVYSK